MFGEREQEENGAERCNRSICFGLFGGGTCPLFFLFSFFFPFFFFSAAAPIRLADVRIVRLTALTALKEYV